jgi:hypothetical protein
MMARRYCKGGCLFPSVEWKSNDGFSNSTVVNVSRGEGNHELRKMKSHPVAFDSVSQCV